MTGVSEPLEFSVNGRNVSLDCPRETPLLHILRDELDLKTVRFGCGQGTCGSCTVIVDGKPILSCDIPVGEIAGTSVETAEVLAAAPRHPLLEAFLDHQAGQCGYCLPGILMAAKALLDADPDRTRESIAEALDANLCRCGAHARILDAVETAARSIREGSG